MMTERYYLKADHQTEWNEVTREQFIAAEQAAGFRSKFGPNHPATGGFTGGGMRGRVEYVPEQPRPEQGSGEATTASDTDTCPKCGKSDCSHAWEIDAPAAPEQGEKWGEAIAASAEALGLIQSNNTAAVARLIQQHSTLMAQRERLLAAIKKFVDYYDGPNAGRLGNGQARRSLDEFRAVLTTIEQEGREGQ